MRSARLSKTSETASKVEKSIKALAKADPKLGRVIKHVGSFTLQANEIQSPFEALAESIVYQQLSGKAAATIFGRVKAIYGEPATLKADDVGRTEIEVLRAAGCSQAKALALKDLAAKTLSGELPTLDEMSSMDDDLLVERLVTIRGVGRWTAEMLLIFKLGRMNVLPAADYGIRKGFALTYGLADLPTPKALLAHGEIWSPYRTAASWYLWRALELPPSVW